MIWALLLTLSCFFLSVNACTLPHPRHNNGGTTIQMTRDDQMLINKGVYIPSPSPAPPPDGSYYNMNSDRYLSYPPMVSKINELPKDIQIGEWAEGGHDCWAGLPGRIWPRTKLNEKQQLCCIGSLIARICSYLLFDPLLLPLPPRDYFAQLTKVLWRMLCSWRFASASQPVSQLACEGSINIYMYRSE